MKSRLEPKLIVSGREASRSGLIVREDFGGQMIASHPALHMSNGSGRLNRESDPIIFVDSDACPVKDEAKKVAERLGLVITFVSNGGVRPSRDPMVRVIVVPAGADAADDWIVENAVANDIVLTADIPLASRAIDKGCHVLGFTGKPFTTASIGMALAMRDLKQHLRETGEIAGYNPGFRPADRSAFLSALDTLGRKAKTMAGK
jgi:uncharacterized protein YaiI (UPF0178 family)